MMRIAQEAEQSTLPPLGIIAGSTELPKILAQTCIKQGRDVFVIALEDAAEPEHMEELPHEWVRLGAIGRALSALKAHDVQEIVMAGKVHRPKLSGLRPDLKATKLLARIGSNFLKGDDELLRTIVVFLEDEGFRVVGIDDVAEELLTPEGLIGSIYPDKRSQTDIEYGVKIAKGIGALDIGQSVIVQNHQVIGVEAIEGTRGLIERCASLKPQEKGGVLVKVLKPKQERRVDLPTIGIETIEQVAAAGLAGIAAEAGGSLMLHRSHVARRADALGIFVIGFTITE